MNTYDWRGSFIIFRIINKSKLLLIIIALGVMEAGVDSSLLNFLLSVAGGV